jgi:hypothetical protein
MQEALGTDYSDLNRSARQASDDLTTEHCLHSFPGIAFSLLIQASARCADIPTGISLCRCVSAPVPAGFRSRIEVAGI